jgi:hypothetical protein
VQILGWSGSTVRDALVRLRKYDIYDVSRTTNNFTLIGVKLYDLLVSVGQRNTATKHFICMRF